MKRSFLSGEFIFSIFALVLSTVLVHAVYTAVVRPNANEFMKAERARLEENPDAIQRRSIWVIIKDYEQEACFILFFWAVAILVYKGVAANQQNSLLQRDLIQIPEGIRVLPEDSRDLARKIQALPASTQHSLLPRALLAALHRFESTRNIQHVSDAVSSVCRSESEKLDSELSMIRYIAWAIPSIGFIGTVRGIGEALANANAARSGDISGVTDKLGVAFNSTLIALFISIVLMFVVHQVQRTQERLTLDAEQYADLHLIRHMQV